jgi:predicted ABC-type sugar transport system permease subunit
MYPPSTTIKNNQNLNFKKIGEGVFFSAPVMVWILNVLLKLMCRRLMCHWEVLEPLRDGA